MKTPHKLHPIDVTCSSCGALEETVCTFSSSAGHDWMIGQIVSVDGRDYHACRIAAASEKSS